MGNTVVGVVKACLSCARVKVGFGKLARSCNPCQFGVLGISGG